MTNGFQQQQPAVNFAIPKSAAVQHQKGQKLDAKPTATPRPLEPRSFR